jgi:hypothetical protein
VLGLVNRYNKYGVRCGFTRNLGTAPFFMDFWALCPKVGKADTMAFSISFGLLRSWLNGEDGLLNVLKGQE